MAHDNSMQILDVKHYKLLYATSLFELNAQIAQAMDDNWKICGKTQSQQTERSAWGMMYYQAVVILNEKDIALEKHHEQHINTKPIP